jgi:hypothetical protein
VSWALSTAASGNDVRAKLAGYLHNTVFQDQLALLQPLQLKLIFRIQAVQRENRRVKIPVLLHQNLKLALKSDSLVIAGNNGHDDRRNPEKCDAKNGLMSRTRTGEVKPPFGTDAYSSPQLLRVNAKLPLPQWKSRLMVFKSRANVLLRRKMELFGQAGKAVSRCPQCLQQGGESMSLETHLAELERKHRTLDSEISTELQHANTDSSKLLSLKRRKLQLKDAISKLRREMDSKTIH